MKKQMYQDAKGRKYVVESNGGHKAEGNLFFCGQRRWTENGVHYSRIPKGLDWRKSWTEAQKDLDALAKKKGWEPWDGPFYGI